VSHIFVPGSLLLAVFCSMTSLGTPAARAEADYEQSSYYENYDAEFVNDDGQVDLDCCECDPWDDGCHGGHDLKHNRVDTHAPAHLFGDHAHKQGQWMVEYKYMNMYMDGNRTGTRSLTDQQALDFINTVPPGVPGVNAYMATPTSMTMEMHMMHIMYGYTDCITLYVMPMWQVNTMDHLRRNATTFRTTNDGFSDFSFGALWKVWENDTDELIFNIGFSAPTGDIDNLTSIPTGSPTEFPYPMRLGSGTWDARPGVTFKRYWEYWSGGLQAQFDLPLGMNDQDYRMGNEYRLNAWVARILDCDKKLAVTFRTEALFRSNYVGADPNLNPAMISTADPDMRGGEFINFGYGAMYLFREGSRLNFEIAHKVYQRLRGVQLEQDWSLAASWSKSF